MRGFAVPEDKDKLVLRPVKDPIPPLSLAQTQRFRRVSVVLAGGENLSSVAPVHTGKVNRTGSAVPHEEFETRAQELDEFLLCHLA
jgi:hypothetical protein